MRNAYSVFLILALSGAGLCAEPGELPSTPFPDEASWRQFLGQVREHRKTISPKPSGPIDGRKLSDEQKGRIEKSVGFLRDLGPLRVHSVCGHTIAIRHDEIVRFVMPGGRVYCALKDGRLAKPAQLGYGYEPLDAAEPPPDLKAELEFWLSVTDEELNRYREEFHGRNFEGL